MTTTLLAAFPSPSQGVWHLGPVPLRAYALFIIVGIIAALVIGDRRWEARGGERGVIYDIALWAVPFGLIGGRLYHVLTDWPTYFGPNGAGPAAALRIWDGGLGIWGAVALGAVGAWIACKRRGIPLPAFGDAIAPGIVLAQAIGRLGNYFNQELYGRPTDVPWGLEIFYRVDPSGIIDVHSLNGVSNGQVAAVVHPTFLYELICNLLVFALLLYVDKRYKIGHGRLFALYVAGYCVGRFAVELMRDDFATLIAGVRINTFTATFVFIGAIVYFILAPKGREAPETLRGNAVDDDAGDVGSQSRRPAETVEKELAEAAATTGVVAATTVALKEDESESKADSDSESDPENDWPFSSEPDSDPDDAPVEDDAAVTEFDLESEPQDEAVDDEALAEAEVTADPALAVETVAEAEEEQLIDEDHDPVDDEDLESLQDEVAGVAEQGPVSEQLEQLDVPDAKADVDEQAAGEEEAAEGEALIEAEAPVDEPEAEPAVDEPEDEADFEAGVAADPAMAVETDAEAEGQLIDEDHDPVDDEDLESLQDDVAVVAEQGPVSEQQEELDVPDAKADVDEQAADEEEAAEGEALIEAEAAVDEPEAEPDPEAGVAADPAMAIETDAEAESQLIDEDLESLQNDVAVVAEQSPVSEQQEELDVPDAKADVDEQAVDEEEAAEGEALVVEAEEPAGEDPEAEDPEAEDPDTDGETSDVETAASDYVVVTTPPPASSQPQGSRLGRLLRRRR